MHDFSGNLTLPNTINSHLNLEILTCSGNIAKEYSFIHILIDKNYNLNISRFHKIQIV